MIQAESRGMSRLASRLAARAARLAEAAAESRYRARRGDEFRWRRSDLLWPLFSKRR